MQTGVVELAAVVRGRARSTWRCGGSDRKREREKHKHSASLHTLYLINSLTSIGLRVGALKMQDLKMADKENYGSGKCKTVKMMDKLLANFERNYEYLLSPLSALADRPIGRNIN